VSAPSTPVHAHGNDFALSLVKASHKPTEGDLPDRVATLLIVSPRPGGGAAFGTKALITMPSVKVLVDYLYENLPEGTTLSIHPERRAYAYVIPPPPRLARPLLRLV
jgi:hypothetical protein